MTAPRRGPLSAWQRFWFEPQETSTLALFRIAFGLVVLGWTASQGPNLLDFYGPHGVLPHAGSDGPGSWGVLTLWHGSAAVVVLCGVVVAFSIAECIHGAVNNPLIADLAPPALLGRGKELRIVEGNRGVVGQPLQDSLVMVGVRARPLAAHVQ